MKHALENIFQHPVCHVAILLSLTLAIYWNAIFFEFQISWDDGFYVIDNPLIREFSLNNIKAIFLNTFQGHYTPIHIFSYSFDYSLFELNPYGYHLVNIAIHLLNSILVYLLLNKITKNKFISFFVAMIFSVHPVNVESVVWISQRKTLLAATFCLSSFLLYLRWEKTNKLMSLFLSLLMFVLGLLSKASIVLFPIVLAGYQIWHKGESYKKLLLLVPYLVCCAGAIALTLFGFSSEKVVYELSASDIFFKVYPTMLPVLVKYLVLLAWPFHLSAFYDTANIEGYLHWQVICSFLFLFGLLLMILASRSRQAYFWLLWSVVFFLPTSNIIPLQTFYADRYLYLPMIGVFGCVAIAVFSLMHNFRRIREYHSVLSGVLLLVAGLYFACGTVRYLPVWKDEITLWEHTVKGSPNLFKPQLNLGVAYDRAGRLEEAVKHYRLALGLYPDPSTLMNLKIAEARLKRRQNHN